MFSRIFGQGYGMFLSKAISINDCKTICYFCNKRGFGVRWDDDRLASNSYCLFPLFGDWGGCSGNCITQSIYRLVYTVYTIQLTQGYITPLLENVDLL